VCALIQSADRQNTPRGGVDVDAAQPAILRLATLFVQMTDDDDGAARPIRNRAERLHQRTDSTGAVQVGAAEIGLERIENESLGLHLDDGSLDPLVGEGKRFIFFIYHMDTAAVSAQLFQFLRYRISEAFNVLVKKLFDAHKKDALPEAQASILEDLKTVMEEYPKQKTADQKTMYKYHLLTKQLGLDTRHLTEEENRVLMKVIERSSVLKRGRRGR